jgi:hypothetical protein
MVTGMYYLVVTYGEHFRSCAAATKPGATLMSDHPRHSLSS